MVEHEPQDESVVKKGGIASDVEAEDVTRDTYGFSEGAPEGDEAAKEDARRRLEELLPNDTDGA
jgi:hypothetical protein